MSYLPDKLPGQLTLELTPRCNYKCPYCYCLWHEYPELARNVLTLEQWMSVIDEAVAKECRSFLFTGGEVLLYPDLKALIEYTLSKHGTRIALYTNASRMTEELLQYFKQHNVRLTTSLQGLRTYADMTGTRRKFYRTVEFISRCSEINFPCSVGITATAVNAFEIEDIVSAAAFAGASIIQVSVFMDAGRGKNNKLLKLEQSDWEKIKERIKKLECSQSVVFCDEMVCNCMEDKDFKCPAGNSFGTVSPNGVYRKCLHYYQGR